MSISPEMLAAYADDQLDGAERAMVEQALAQDPALAQEVATHRALRARLVAHFAPILEETLPDSLTRALKAPPAPQTATVVSIETARARRREREARSPNPEPMTAEPMGKAPARPRWAIGAGIALAACVALAVVIGRPAMVPASNYAAPELAQALDSRLSGEQGGSGPQVLLSFADATGAVCRGFAGSQASGIACHDAHGWRLERRFPGVTAQEGAYRQAGSTDPKLMAAMQDMAAGGALDPAAERAARARGWTAAPPPTSR
jgi:hypothetical protein